MQASNATSRIVGALFIAATAAAVAGDLLLRPIRDDPGYLANFASHQVRVIVGVLSEVVLAAAVVGIAAMLFPVLKRQSEGLAIGYVGARIVEATIIVVGGMSSLLLLTCVSPTSTVSILLTLPIGVNEMVLAVWLIVRGFDTPTIASGPVGRVTSGV